MLGSLNWFFFSCPPPTLPLDSLKLGLENLISIPAVRLENKLNKHVYLWTSIYDCTCFNQHLFSVAWPTKALNEFPSTWMIRCRRYFFKGLLYFVLLIECNRKQEYKLHQESRATLQCECFPLASWHVECLYESYVVCDCKLKRLQFHSTKGHF